ncbi:MAG: hypothetical protein HYY86_01135 [Candidatus Harrisonbacteria bacterium]|nr:hypothetical protein [Candidatus Harrisonbacteria bacterium]
MEQLLTKLKSIQPTQNFQERSKAIILLSRQNQPQTVWNSLLAMPHQRITFGLTALAVFLILGSLSALNNSSVSQSLVSSLDQENLTAEVKSLDIQIQLAQIQYYQDSIKKIEVALKEISEESEL